MRRPGALGAAQGAVYAAEAAALGGVGQRWRRVAEAQAYVDGLVGSSWWFDQWPWCVRVVVERRGSGARWSTYAALDDDGPGGRPTEAALVLASLTQATVLHELAHVVGPVGVGHGPAFVGVLVALVRREMGFFAYADLCRELEARLPGGAASVVTAGVD